jgi:hypothetical protein
MTDKSSPPLSLSLRLRLVSILRIFRIRRGGKNYRLKSSLNGTLRVKIARTETKRAQSGLDSLRGDI